MEKAVNNQAQSRTKEIVLCGLSIALMAVSAWITVPFGPIPFTLQTLAIMFVLFALTPKCALISIAGYLVLGAIGLPVFSSFQGWSCSITWTNRWLYHGLFDCRWNCIVGWFCS